MAKRLVLTERAKRDLRSIHRFIAKDDPDAATRFVADLSAKAIWIAETDFSGMARDHVRPGLQALPYRRRCIYFRTFADRVVIVRVLHQAQDITAQSFDE